MRPDLGATAAVVVSAFVVALLVEGVGTAVVAALVTAVVCLSVDGYRASRQRRYRQR